jgi:hypothetical protein
VAGSARLVGAAIGYLARVPQRLIAAVMAFGGGVLISALSFELMDEAYRRAGSAATGFGFLTGAASIAPPTCIWPAGAPSTEGAPTASSPQRPSGAAAASPSPSAPCWMASPNPSSSGSP